MADSVDVLVVGGGSTGTGIARDLAMRGFGVTLVEKGNLTHGTTGRMHGLLHSGGRYAVSDRASAEECIEENRVLREIATHCVEMTGGLFVQLSDDPDDYFEEKLRGCRECNIPAEVLSGEEVREAEPYLADDVKRAIRVPDAAIDPFRLCVANAASAIEHGARVETHAEVTDVLVEGEDGEGEARRASERPNGHGLRGRVVGVEVEHDSGPGKRVHREPGTTEEIRADYVVNATGAWAGRVGAMAGVDVEVRPSKGVMVVMNSRQVDTVVNRCRPKGDADIVVPHETACILGTTDEEVDDPEEYPEEQWEVDAMIDTLSELVPILEDARTLRSFWGVRPLYEPPGTGTADPTDITRDFFLLDHAERDGLPGMATIVGGKLTTYRLMAEKIADHVCEEFGVDADCRTADEPLPGSEDIGSLDAYMEEFGLRSPVARRSAQRLGSFAPEVLGGDGPNPVICACEAVTAAEIDRAVEDAGTDLNAVRIRTRASMGNCQGAFCCDGIAGRLYPEYDEPTIRSAYGELYRERWKGERHGLWGEQLSQAMLKYALHATTMNRDRDPADRDDPIGFDAFDAGPAAGATADAPETETGSGTAADGGRPAGDPLGRPGGGDDDADS